MLLDKPSTGTAKRIWAQPRILHPDPNPNLRSRAGFSDSGLFRWIWAPSEPGEWCENTRTFEQKLLCFTLMPPSNRFVTRAA